MRPSAWEVPASDDRTTITAGFNSICHMGLVDLFAQSANYLKYDGRSKAWLPMDPPKDMARVSLTHTGEWGFPTVAGIITTPTMRRDGSMISTPGYDPATRLYYVPDSRLVMPDILEAPTREDALQALSVLTQLLVAFPFVKDCDRSVALSGMISAVIRGALTVVPLHAFTAPTAGSGKSYAVDVIAATATGRIAPVMSAGKTEEEMEKRLGAQLLAGVPILFHRQPDRRVRW